MLAMQTHWERSGCTMKLHDVVGGCLPWTIVVESIVVAA